MLPPETIFDKSGCSHAKCKFGHFPACIFAILNVKYEEIKPALSNKNLALAESRWFPVNRIVGFPVLFSAKMRWDIRCFSPGRKEASASEEIRCLHHLI